ncbi:hypothetical protein NDU88_004862 [Pleurodeles waltl]|uniref:Uncharacterized protein n=1 Tax=Pleurodeles waltl TaxID=8319 RepID=A0AAV7PM37_PLEWA|nr:hypothetical protein NDU88_004862 [Pleurodeles waltl]
MPSSSKNTRPRGTQKKHGDTLGVHTVYTTLVVAGERAEHPQPRMKETNQAVDDRKNDFRCRYHQGTTEGWMPGTRSAPASVQRDVKRSCTEALFEALLLRMDAMDQAVASLRTQPTVAEAVPSGQKDRPWRLGKTDKGDVCPDNDPSLGQSENQGEKVARQEEKERAGGVSRRSNRGKEEGEAAEEERRARWRRERKGKRAKKRKKAKKRQEKK